MNISWMSRSRHSLPFSRYSLSPVRNSRRVMTSLPRLELLPLELPPADLQHHAGMRRVGVPSADVPRPLSLLPTPYSLGGSCLLRPASCSLGYFLCRQRLHVRDVGLGVGGGLRRAPQPRPSLLRGSRPPLRSRVRHIAAPVHIGVDERQRHFGHARGLAVARAGEDDVFHARAAQRLGRLLAQHPGDGVGNVGFSAAVRPHNSGDAVAVEFQLGAVAERLESQNLQLLQFQHVNPFGWQGNRAGIGIIHTELLRFR